MFLAAFSSTAGNLAFSLVVVAVYVIRQVKNDEAVWSWETSYFRHPMGGLNWFNVGIMAAYTLTQIVATCFVVI